MEIKMQEDMVEKQSSDSLEGSLASRGGDDKMQGVIVSSNGPDAMMINQGDWWGGGQRTKGPDVEWIIPIHPTTSPHGDNVQIRKWHLILKVFYHLPPKFVKTGKQINGREVAGGQPLPVWRARGQPCL